MVRTLSRLASALGVSLPAAAIAAFPAALRTSASAASAASDAGIGLPAAWLALAGALVLPMTAAVLVLRGARTGLAVIAGEAGAGDDAFAEAPVDVAFDSQAVPDTIPDPRAVPDEHVPSRASLLRAAMVGWGVVLCAGLAPLGALLRARTHHHGLAGVTFAVLGLAFALGAAIAVRRVVEILSTASPRTRRIALGAFWIGVGLAVLVLGAAGGARSAGVVAAAPAASTSALVIDLVAFVLAAACAARPLGTGSRAANAERGFVVVSGLTVLLAVAGLGSLSRSAVLLPELARTSPFFALATGAPADGAHDSADTPDAPDAPGTAEGASPASAD